MFFIINTVLFLAQEALYDTYEYSYIYDELSYKHADHSRCGQQKDDGRKG